MKPLITHIAAGADLAAAFNPDGSTRKRFFFDVEHDHPYLVISQVWREVTITIAPEQDAKQAMEAWLTDEPTIQNYIFEQVEAVIRWTKTAL